jgi:hypothetical protein
MCRQVISSQRTYQQRAKDLHTRSACTTLFDGSCTPLYQCFLPENGLVAFVQFTRNMSSSTVAFALHNDVRCT